MKQHLINQIRLALADQGMTQVQLASMLGVTKTWVHLMLKEKASIEKLIDVLDRLGYTVELSVKYTGHK